MNLVGIFLGNYNTISDLTVYFRGVMLCKKSRDSKTKLWNTWS
jgi:hypothetical protein